MVARDAMKLAFLVLCTLIATPAAGESWRERAATAPLVVVGRAETATSRWEGSLIYTTVDFSIRRVVRGDAGSSVTLRQRGGVVGRIGQRVTHVDLLEPGRPYLLFLSRDSAGAWTPTSRGVHRIEAGAIEDGSGSGERVGGEALEDVLAEIGGGG